MLIAFFSAQAILGGNSVNGQDIALSFTDSGVARSVVGGALYLTLVAVFGVGLGAMSATPPAASPPSPACSSSSRP